MKLLTLTLCLVMTAVAVYVVFLMSEPGLTPKQDWLVEEFVQEEMTKW